MLKVGDLLFNGGIVTNTPQAQLHHIGVLVTVVHFTNKLFIYGIPPIIPTIRGQISGVKLVFILHNLVLLLQFLPMLNLICWERHGYLKSPMHWLWQMQCTLCFSGVFVIPRHAHLVQKNKLWNISSTTAPNTDHQIDWKNTIVV